MEEINIAIIENQIIDFNIIDECLTPVNLSLDNINFNKKVNEDNFADILSKVKMSLDVRYNDNYQNALDELCRSLNNTKIFIIDYHLLGYIPDIGSQTGAISGISLATKLVDKNEKFKNCTFVFLSYTNLQSSQQVNNEFTEFEKKIGDSGIVQWLSKNWLDDDIPVNKTCIKNSIAPIFKEFIKNDSFKIKIEKIIDEIKNSRSLLNFNNSDQLIKLLEDIKNINYPNSNLVTYIENFQFPSEDIQKTIDELKDLADITN